MTDDEKRQRLLQRLARAGLSEDEWAQMSRTSQPPDLSGLDAREAHARFEALQDASAKEVLAAIPRIKAMLADDAPVVGRGSRVIVFEIRMHALTVLQHLYRISKRELDFGPVVVTKGAPAATLEQRAAASLAKISDDKCAEVLASVDRDLEDRICPPAGDRALVRSYRVLQHLGLIDYETQDVDPSTYLTPLQEEIFASQVPVEPARPFLRIGTASPRRTFAWLFRTDKGFWQVNVTEHPSARKAKEDVDWLGAPGERSVPSEPLAYLHYVAEFLQRGGYLAEVME